MSHAGSLPPQSMATPTAFQSRIEMAGEIALLRKIADLQEQVIKLTALSDPHRFEAGYRCCYGCQRWLPESSFARNGSRRLRSRCPDCDKARRRAVRGAA